jgi:hypothetical protein
VSSIAKWPGGDGAILRFAPLILSVVLLAGTTPAGAFTVNITAANPRTLYLQVGVGSFTGGNYNAGGTAADNPAVNVVSVTVPAAQLGNGTAQTMSTNSGATSSFYDSYVFCNAPAQLYVGGFYRSTTNTGAATLRATSPANLVNASGNTIPFTQISWTSSGNGDTGAQPFPAGTFTGGSQTIGTINRNQWAESCLTFSYANSSRVASGTYTGRVTYTLSTP